MRLTKTDSASGLAGRTRFSFRAFYITTCLLSAFAVLSLVADQTARYKYGEGYGAAQRQAAAQLDVSRLLKRDEECRLVHHAEDKCAFIKANCPDEEAGLLSYLSLYYCALPNAQPFAFTILVLWLGLLFSTIGIAASDFFCINLSTIASILGMSESMAGVTFLAFGNGSPDVFSTFAAMNSHSGSLAIGELIGAAGFITAVVAGSMALVREFKVGKKTFVRDIGFFIVAVSFSMSFLADGSLHLWECCVMIGFYIFYVITVVVWHWYLQQRRRRRERFSAARDHYYTPDNVEIEVQEEYQDDEDLPAGERPSASRRPTEDWAALERGSSPGPDIDSDHDSDSREGRRLATEMSNSMRVVRQVGTRRNTTVTPIRPSLVGAMEFRSVLASLQKSRSTHARPIHLRRYSDDPSASAGHSGGPPSVAVTSELGSNVSITSPDSGSDSTIRHASGHSRVRAVSMNDAARVKHPDPAALSVTSIPQLGGAAATPIFPNDSVMPKLQLEAATSSGPATLAGERASANSTSIPASPTFSISPPPSQNPSRDSSPAPPTKRYNDHLAPPDRLFFNRWQRREDSEGSMHHIEEGDVSPRTRSPTRPSLTIPSGVKAATEAPSPISQFPAYTDMPVPTSNQSSRAPSLLQLPDPYMRNEHSPQASYDSDPDAEQRRPFKWWPYRTLPDPYVILATLFPTLSTWKDKSLIDKFLSVVSAPSIFLLAITLPVVEAETKEEENDEMIDDHNSYRHDLTPGIPRLAPDSPSLEPVEEEGEWTRYRRATLTHTRASSITSPRSPSFHGIAGHSNTAAVAVFTEAHHDQGQAHSPAFPFPNVSKGIASHAQEAGLASNSPLDQPREWNRWLVAVQIFTAPIFVMLIIWANTTAPVSDPESENLGLLLRLILYSLLGSMVLLAVLLLTTSPDRLPKYRFLLCFLGFIVSISWISTIANEVVGVLKAFGVILGISDAILGLTIFAVGNSLGDLVADITVARLGYPVMALSACFGGPMLNILIGIGVSGLYMSIKEANHKHVKHPGKKLRYRPYEIDVSGTLMISAITLLVTLVGLLIVVPLNKWTMNRRIGYGLIALWVVSTIINLAVEITGVFDVSL